MLLTCSFLGRQLDLSPENYTAVQGTSRKLSIFLGTTLLAGKMTWSSLLLGSGCIALDASLRIDPLKGLDKTKYIRA